MALDLFLLLIMQGSIDITHQLFISDMIIHTLLRNPTHSFRSSSLSIFHTPVGVDNAPSLLGKSRSRQYLATDIQSSHAAQSLPCLDEGGLGSPPILHFLSHAFLRTK